MIPVLEIGGTHVSAALVDPAAWTVVRSARHHVDGDASAEVLLDAFAAAGIGMGVDAGSAARWGVAMPDPFDYEHGIGNFAGVAKFAALDGVDVGSALRGRLGAPVSFVNDADAFVLGEWAAGALRGVDRCAGITLGTGVGSGWLIDGHVVDPGIPPGGRIHQLSIDGRPLEDVVSRRAIRREFATGGGAVDLDVREIMTLAREADPLARRVIDDAFAALGQVVGRCVTHFRADVLVVGGSMSASWDVFEKPFRSAAGDLPEIRIAADSDTAPLAGAAVHAARA